MPKPLELRKVIKILKSYDIIYVIGKGRHPKFYDPEEGKSYPVKFSRMGNSTADLTGVYRACPVKSSLLHWG